MANTFLVIVIHKDMVIFRKVRKRGWGEMSVMIYGLIWLIEVS